MLEAGGGKIEQMFCTDLFKWFPWMDKFYKPEGKVRLG
jgi:hypothetical protein